MYVTNSHSLNKFGASEKKTLQIPISFFGSPFFSSNAWQNLRQKIPSNQQVAGFATWIPPMAASRLSTVRKISRWDVSPWPHDSRGLKNSATFFLGDPLEVWKNSRKNGILRKNHETSMILKKLCVWNIFVPKGLMLFGCNIPCGFNDSSILEW